MTGNPLHGIVSTVAFRSVRFQTGQGEMDGMVGEKLLFQSNFISVNGWLYTDTIKYLMYQG